MTETTEQTTEQPAAEQPRPERDRGPQIHLVDESFGHGAPHPCSSLRQVYRVIFPGMRPLMVRVEVHADYHVHQSYAKACVLTQGLSWTELCVNPASEWRRAVIISSEETRDALSSIAKSLVARAAHILSPR